VLELRDLVKRYGDGRHKPPIRAVDGVSLVVEPGEFVALYGPSGSGKTTLLEIISGAERPDRGSVLVGGEDIFGLSERDLDTYRLQRLGIIGPPERLIAGALAIENASLRLAFSSTRKGNTTIEPLMERLGLGDRMGHRTDELSMGERQRVMIALALSTNPMLVLADEPTGNLDTERTREVLGLLQEICAERGAAVLLATHDPQAVLFADRVCELRDGHLGEYQPDHILVPAASVRKQS
jgi:putative ABC transport system ATP-binding protein